MKQFAIIQILCLVYQVVLLKMHSLSEQEFGSKKEN